VSALVRFQPTPGDLTSSDPLSEPISVHAYSAKITGNRVDTAIDASKNSAKLKSVVTVSQATENSSVNLELRDKTGKVLKSQDAKVDANGNAQVEWDLAIGQDVDLWWPVGQGEQPLYNVVAQLKHKVRHKRMLVDST
jgi:beta-mannosidase